MKHVSIFLLIFLLAACAPTAQPTPEATAPTLTGAYNFSGVHLRLHNDSGHDLEDVTLTVGSQVEEIGTLPAGVVSDLVTFTAVHTPPTLHAAMDETVYEWTAETAAAEGLMAGGQFTLELTIENDELHVVFLMENPILQDAQYYADAMGVTLEEALSRLDTQNEDAISALNEQLQTNEADTFAGLWIQHEPEYRIVVAFTRDGEETIRKYAAPDSKLGQLIELRPAQYTYAQLLADQQAVLRILDTMQIPVYVSILVQENHLELGTTDRAALDNALAEADVALPESVVITTFYEPLGEEPPFPITPAPDVFMPQLKQRDISFMTALLIGELIVEDGCLRIRDVYTGEHTLVIWQADYFLNDNSGRLEILDETGAVVAQVGEMIYMGGGEQRTVDNAELRQPVPEQCNSGPFWRMGTFLPEEYIPNVSADLPPTPPTNGVETHPTPDFNQSSVSPAPLLELPFKPGTRWIYERTEYDQPPDSTDIITHTLLVTETAVSIQQQSPYTIIEMRRQMPDTLFASLEEQTFWYILDGQTLYRQDAGLNVENVTEDGRIELIFPLTPGARWHSLSSLHDSDPERQINSWLRQVQRLETVTTPAGTFAQCAYFTEVAGGNHLQTWYCPDVGFVEQRNDHAGTRFGSAEILIAIERQEDLHSSLADGLIYQDLDGHWQLISAGLAVSLTENERQRLMRTDGHHFAVRDDVSYTIQNGDVWATDLTTGESRVLLETDDRTERRVFGLVGDWLLVESFVLGEGGQGVGPLAVIPLPESDSDDEIILVDDWLRGLPVSAPDSRYVVFPTDEGVFAFYPDGSIESLSLDRFASASFSPDGHFIAFHLGSQIEIVDLESGEVVQSTEFIPIGRDSPPDPPQWHPANRWIAFEYWQDTAVQPFAVRLLNIETGEVYDLAHAAVPRWHPDGDWLAYVRYGRPDETRIVLAETGTWTEQATTFAGQPAAWVQLP